MKMWSKVILMLLLISFVGLSWSNPAAISMACPVGFNYVYGRCLDSEKLKFILEELDK